MKDPAAHTGRISHGCDLTLDLTLAQTTSTLADFVAEAVDMEVHRPGPSRVPWEFAGIRRAVACGTVVVWLRG